MRALELGACQPPCAAIRVARSTEVAALFGRFLRYYADAVRTRGGLPRPTALTLTGFTLRGLPPGSTCRVTVLQRRMCLPAKAGCALGSACGKGVGALPGASSAPADARRAAPAPGAVAACAAPHTAPVASVQVVADEGGRAGACLQNCVIRGELKVLVRATGLACMHESTKPRAIKGSLQPRPGLA